MISLATASAERAGLEARGTPSREDMKSPAYYNEFDPYAAQWLRNLIAAGHIAPGEVDERSITDVSADDIRTYTQCHFFAGIGVWSHALRLAGWDDDRPVWTGSPPCQPFSVAGAGAGTADERHLWPHFFRLIAERKPAAIFGEQVEAAIRHGWLDLVQTDMEGIGYAFAAVGIPAAGVGAPHIRQRLFFVADTASTGSFPGALTGIHSGKEGAGSWDGEPKRSGADDRLDYAESGRDGTVRPVAEAGEFGGLEHAGSIGRNGWETTAPGHDDDRAASERAQGEHGLGIASAHRLHQHEAGPTNGHWRDADWLFCRDGKWRPVESTTERLADGIADSLGFVRTGEGSFGLSPLKKGAKNRVGRLRGYGNAIVPQVAAEFIKAFMACRP